MKWLIVGSMLLTIAGHAGASPIFPPALSVDELRTHTFNIKLERVAELDSTDDYTAYLVAYEHARLRLHAMVAVPRMAPPPNGFPVVIANHGYVPDPRRYGITSTGIDARPGDYYRSVPGLFTSRGFLTVLPDYRGHNNSDGFDYINPQDERSVHYYAEDVVALMSAIDQLEQADTDNLFLWSHSMGGHVAVRVLLATDRVRASSFWATMRVDDYGHRFNQIDGPVIVHHAIGDEATAPINSIKLGRKLMENDLLHALTLYPDDEHYFAEARREQAADADAALFRSVMTTSDTP